MILEDPQRLANLLLAVSKQANVLTPIQVGKEIQELMTYNKKSEVARMLGVSVGTISMYLRLMEMPNDIQDIVGGKVSIGAFRYIAKLDTSDIQDMINVYLEKNLTVKELDNIVQTRIKTGRSIDDITNEIFLITRPNIIKKYIFISTITTEIDSNIAIDTIKRVVPGVESIRIDGDVVKMVTSEKGNQYLKEYSKKYNVDTNNVITDIVTRN